MAEVKRRPELNAKICAITIDELVASQSPLKVFAYDNGTQPVNFNKIFVRILREMGIEMGTSAQTGLCRVCDTHMRH